jgi:syndecan 4
VVLLRKESEGSTRLSPEFILQGPGLASSFGYDVTVVDLNGDG